MGCPADERRWVRPRLVAVTDRESDRGYCRRAERMIGQAPASGQSSASARSALAQGEVGRTVLGVIPARCIGPRVTLASASAPSGKRAADWKAVGVALFPSLQQDAYAIGVADRH